MLLNLKNIYRMLSPANPKAHFSDSIYSRHSPDVHLGIVRGDVASGYEHYVRYGQAEMRPHAHRKLRPGQSTTFNLAVPEKALTGFQLHLGVEKSGSDDIFEVSIVDGGRVVFSTTLPYGAIALDRHTDFFTGLIENLSDKVQIKLRIPGISKNCIWLLRNNPEWKAKQSADCSAFLDDPTKVPEKSIGIILSPVSQCNQNCPHCISNFSRKSFNKLSDRAQEEIRSMASNGRISRVSVDYSGDPFFTNARYFPIFEFIDQLGCEFRLDTNGAYVDEEAMRRIARGRLFGLNFSLDAATADTHRRLRPGNVPFDIILANIRHAVSILDEAGRDDVMTSANFSLMKSNIGEAVQFVDLCLELGLRSVNFQHVHVYQSATHDESLSSDPNLYNRIYEQLLSKLISSGLTFYTPPPYVLGLETSGRRRCSAPWESALILSNGDVQACCVPGTKIGNIHQTSFEEIWASKEAKAFRQQAASPNGSVCSQCAFYSHRGIAGSISPL